MSTSSRSTIFSIRSKKSNHSAEVHAGPAYDDLPMSPRLPITVSTIIPPSQQNGRADLRLFGPIDYVDGEESSDAYSVKSEPRNGFGGHHSSLKGAGSGTGSLSGGVSGPRPFPPRSGSTERVHESAKYNTLGPH